MSKLTHLNESGEAHMVDVGSKNVTAREAVAEGLLAVARVAGIMAAKKTAGLVPLCHTIPLTAVEIDLTPDEAQSTVRCRATVRTQAQTGVEMEALAAVEIALLTVYDMCKAVDRGMVLTDIGLVSKTGGKSGDWHR